MFNACTNWNGDLPCSGRIGPRSAEAHKRRNLEPGVTRMPWRESTGYPNLSILNGAMLSHCVQVTCHNGTDLAPGSSPGGGSGPGLRGCQEVAEERRPQIHQVDGLTWHILRGFQCCWHGGWLRVSAVPDRAFNSPGGRSGMLTRLQCQRQRCILPSPVEESQRVHAVGRSGEPLPGCWGVPIRSQ